MKLEIAKIIVDQNEDLSLYENYVGRGPSKPTAGIKCENLGCFVEAVARAAYEICSRA